MPYLQDELLVPLMLAERRDAAGLYRLTAAIPGGSWQSRAESRLARLLCALATHLERAAERRAERRMSVLTADFCPGCGS